MRRQLVGEEELTEAVQAGEAVRLILLKRGHAVSPAVEAALEAGAVLRRVSSSVLRRLGRYGSDAQVLALVGPAPQATLDELLARPGAVWLLDGPAYPGNTGFALRQAEVSGAAGIVVDDRELVGGRRRALRTSMRADWFFPVLWESAPVVVAAARAAGRPVVVVEHGGDRAPWELEPIESSLLVVGNERDGVSPEVLAAADHLVSLPMAGFIPSYNVQAAMAALTADRLRRRDES